MRVVVGRWSVECGSECGCNWRCAQNDSVADSRAYAAFVKDAQFLSGCLYGILLLYLEGGEGIYLTRAGSIFLVQVWLVPLNLKGDGTGFSRNNSGVLEKNLEFAKSASVASEGLVSGI